MAKDQTKRIRPMILQEDRDILSALKGFTDPVYKPANPLYEQAKLQAAQDATVAAEWAFHNLILGSKDQVKAQYGDDSAEYAGIGLTKKSERQSPGPSTADPTPKP